MPGILLARTRNLGDIIEVEFVRVKNGKCHISTQMHKCDLGLDPLQFNCLENDKRQEGTEQDAWAK